MEDIFSTEPVKKKIEKCPNPKVKIIVDTREKQSLIAANLIEQKANLQFEKLDIGDYLIGNTIIERKTIQDFISSMINKRLIEQLKNMKKYEKNILLIEGFNYNYENFRIHENALRGMFLSVAVDFKTPIIFTKDESDTAKFLILEAKKYEKRKTINSMRPMKNLKTFAEQKKFILEGFPGIGGTLSIELLNKYKTLKNIFNLTKEDLKKVQKFDENKINLFKHILED
ncbi:MAG: hypothetical protein IH845_02495 [Nanoarchaeota archaeon]|nr:hypothetical protein [Nanoarchaeota archaeon]